MFKFLLAFGLTAAFPLTVSAADPISPDHVIGGAVGDWDKDGRADLALLVAPQDETSDNGIYVYLRDKEHDLLRLVTVAPNKVWGNAKLDGFYGQDPTISANANGSISVHSENSGVGRGRWEQTLTLAYRNGAFIVAGYTYSEYDTLDPEAGGSCDLNMLTGKGKRNEKDFKTEPQTVSITDWNDKIARKACGFKDEE